MSAAQLQAVSGPVHRQDSPFESTQTPFMQVSQWPMNRCDYPFIHSIRFAWSCFCSTGSLGESCCLGAQKVKKAPPTKRLKIRMIQIVTFFTADVVEEKGQPPRYKKVQNIKQNCVVLTARMPRGNPVTRATPLNQHSGNMVHTWSVGDTLI